MMLMIMYMYMLRLTRWFLFDVFVDEIVVVFCHLIKIMLIMEMMMLTTMMI